MPNFTKSLDEIAALWLLQTPLLATRTAPYLGETIAWRRLRAELSPATACRSELLLLDAAYDLAGGEPERPLSLRELALTLDDGNLRALVEAIFARRGEFIDLGGSR